MQCRIGLAPETYKAVWGFSFREPPNPYLDVSAVDRSAGRGDWIAAQILIETDADAMLSVGRRPALSKRALWPQLRIEALSGGLGEAKLNILGYMEDDDRSFRTDVLLNDDAAELTPGKLGCVFVEIPVPEDAAPGRYTAVINIYMLEGFGDERLYKTLTINAGVYAARLPKGPDRPWILSLFQHPSNIARKHEVRLWSDEHFEVLERYIKSLARLGQKTAMVVLSEIPWSGQSSINCKQYPSDLFEYSIVRISRDAEGAFRYDFSALERYVELCFKYGIDGDIHLMGLANVWTIKGWHPEVADYPEPLRVRYLDEKDGCYRYMREGGQIRAYFAALHAYFIEKGWIDKVRVMADEPSDMEHYERCNAEVRKYAPRFKFVACMSEVDFMEEHYKEIECFVPYVAAVNAHSERIAKIRDLGVNSFYWYVCCGPDWPNTFLGSPLVESRLLPILTSFFGYKGFLRWNYTVWPEDPRNKIYFGRWPAGDTNFVYPGNHGGPLLTLRYMALRRGGEDFDLLERLKAEGKADAYEAALDCVLKTRDPAKFSPAAGKRQDAYSLEDEDYQRARRIALEALSGE